MNITVTESDDPRFSESVPLDLTDTSEVRVLGRILYSLRKE